MKAFIQTHGCQMNEQDSLQMKGLLNRLGFSGAQNPYEADLILINSCSIREKAVQKIYSDLGRLRSLKEDRPGLIVGLAGCVAQAEKEKLIQRFPFLDLVFGPDALRHLPEMISTILQKKKGEITNPIVRTEFDLREDFHFVDVLPDCDENQVKAFVNIQKGCDNVCSFCIVPRVRGREVSRPSSQIVSEIQHLTDNGVVEVTLLGQNVNSYGLKNSGEVKFSELLRLIARETDLKRLRFTTSHPRDVGEDLIRLFGELEILCPHFHLPVQSGSDRILKAMRRHYTRDQYLKTVSALRQVCPGMAFSTDIIVGFPGETPQDFKETLDLMREVSFDLSFSFIYSPRPGTSALSLFHQVPLKEASARLASERLSILNNLQREISKANNLKMEGQRVSVLVESAGHTDYPLMGRTGTNKIVHFKPKINTEGNLSLDSLVGKFIDVDIVKSNPFSLIGEADFNPFIASIRGFHG